MIRDDQEDGIVIATEPREEASPREMKAAFSAWKIVYWEPHLTQIEAEKRAAKINREFACTSDRLAEAEGFIDERTRSSCLSSLAVDPVRPGSRENAVERRPERWCGGLEGICGGKVTRVKLRA